MRTWDNRGGTGNQERSDNMSTTTSNVTIEILDFKRKQCSECGKKLGRSHKSESMRTGLCQECWCKLLQELRKTE